MGRGYTEARTTQEKPLLVKIPPLPLTQIKVIDEEWCVQGLKFCKIFFFWPFCGDAKKKKKAYRKRVLIHDNSVGCFVE